MFTLRMLIAAALLAAIAVLPIAVARSDLLPGGLIASAAQAGSPSADNHDDDEDDNHDDDEDDNDDNWNWNGNWNDNDEDENENDVNANRNGNWNENDEDGDDDEEEIPPPPPPPPPAAVSHCYAAGEVGALSLILEGGSVTLDVVPASSFPRVTRVSLTKVDPWSAPPPAGSRLDEIVFELGAQDGCDGSGLGELPSDANLGVAFSVPAEKPRLRFAVWDGGRWLAVPTVPDPSPDHPYVSATIRRTGIYVLYQAP